MSDLQFGYFDRLTPAYDDERMRFAVSEIRDDQIDNPSILDVGCGDGSILSFLEVSGIEAEFRGVDPAPAYVELARRKGHDASVGSVLDQEVVTANEGCHDYVLMVSVLHHLVDGSRWETCRDFASTAVANCLRMLSPHGKLLIFEPCHEPSFINRSAFEVKSRVIRMGGNRRIGVSWVNLGAPLVAFFTPDQLEDMVVAGGATVRRRVDVGAKRMWPATRLMTGMIVTSSIEHMSDGTDQLRAQPPSSP